MGSVPAISDMRDALYISFCLIRIQLVVNIMISKGVVHVYSASHYAGLGGRGFCTHATAFISALN